MKKLLLVWCIISSLGALLYEFFKWQLVNAFTVFLMPILGLTVYLVFAVVAIIALVVLWRRRYWIPISIQLFTVLVLLFFPFNRLNLALNFHIHKAARQQIAQLIEGGSLTQNVLYNTSLIHLPKQYAPVSSGGGDVVVKENSSDKYDVLFFTFRGILDNFSGFVYSPNDTKPTSGEFGGHFVQVQKLQPDWYYVASTD